MDKKRTSIKRRLQRIVLLTCAVSLLVTGALGIGIMLMIRSQSESALISETDNELNNIASSRAGLAEAQLTRYVEYAEMFSDYISEVHAHPENYKARDRWQTLDLSYDKRGRFISPVRRDESVRIEDYIEQISLESNVEDILYPVVTDESKNISAVYWGNESGILTGYEPADNLIPPDFVYDYTQVPWYSMCREAQDIIFTDIYLDGFDRGLTITCAAPFYNSKGDFYGVFGVDVLISSLYEEIVELELGEGAYAFLVDNNGNVISPEGDARSLLESEGIDEATAERLLAADGSVFMENNIYYSSARIESTGWTICLHVPQELAMAPVNSIDAGVRTLIIAFVLLFILIVILVSLVLRRFAGALTGPIVRLTEDVRKINGGNLEYRAAVENNDEIGDLAGSFNNMSAALQGYIADFTRVTAEKERIGAELSVATRIQANLLPVDFPKRGSFELFASMTPAKEVGGDFYDFFYIDDEHMALVMADVSGKGVPAALFMVNAKTLIKNIALRGGNPAQILEEANRRLCESNEAQLFVTAWLGILNLHSGELCYSNAGHEYPALRQGKNHFQLIKRESDVPLAAEDDSSYTEDRLMLSPGDRLFLYTDGLPEAKDPNGKRYGTDAMIASLNRHSELPADAFLAAIKQDADAFTGGMEAFDDLTMMAITFFGSEDKQ